MSKKLYATFAPLLAVVAFALIPATALAVPHWWLGGAALPFNGAKTAVTTKSETPLTLEALGHKITCEVRDSGRVWNTALGVVGKDEVDSFVSSNCAATPALCTTAGFEEVEIIALPSPWNSELEEPVPPTIRDRVTGISLKIECNGVLQDTFTGTLTPKIVNGTTGTEAGCAAGTDTVVEFGAGSGELTDAMANKAKAEGRDCIWKQNGAGGLVRAKNP